MIWQLKEYAKELAARLAKNKKAHISPNPNRGCNRKKELNGGDNWDNGTQ
jgi:hypothetical protein